MEPFKFNQETILESVLMLDGLHITDWPIKVNGQSLSSIRFLNIVKFNHNIEYDALVYVSIK